MKSKFKVTCPMCGQSIRSELRLSVHTQHKGEPDFHGQKVGHLTRCNGDQRWKKKFRAEMAKKSKPQLALEEEK